MTMNNKDFLRLSMITSMIAASMFNVAYADLSESKTSQTDVNTPTASSKMFMDCMQVHNESARLACFDNVAMTGQVPVLSKPKKQLDLGKTLSSTFKGKPKIYLDNPTNDLGNHKPDDSDVIEVIYDNNVTKTVKPTRENLAKIEKFYNVGVVGKTKYVKSNQLGTSKKIVNNTDNDYFLNTEVIRSFYKTGDFDNPDYTAVEKQTYQVKNQTNPAEQNLSNKPKSQQQSKQMFMSTANRIKEDGSRYSPLSLAYDLDVNDEVGTWKPRPYNPMYILPLFMHDSPNRSPSTPNQPVKNYTQNEYRSPELKFQLSFKSKVAQDLFDTDADLWLGYTQQSHWQVYNEDNSRPFRAHDYMPELFLTQPVKATLPFGGKLRMIGAGFMHHSNGESDPLSRSWNKAYLMGGAEWGKLTVIPRLWTRLNTDTSSKPDDNPDIEDYYGYGDVKMYYDLDQGKSIAGTFRLNPSTGKGAAQVDYIHPLDNNVNLYLNLFHGYGESIIDYNDEDTAVGIGVMLNDWRGL